MKTIDSRGAGGETFKYAHPPLPPNFKAFVDALKPIYENFPGAMEARFSISLPEHKYRVHHIRHYGMLVSEGHFTNLSSYLISLF